MTRVARSGAVGYVIAAVLFLAGYVWMPTRVTDGAGSLRCGTALHPERRGVIAQDCPTVGRRRLEDTLRATAVFALVAAGLLPLHRWIEDRPAVRCGPL